MELWEPSLAIKQGASWHVDSLVFSYSGSELGLFSCTTYREIHLPSNAHRLCFLQKCWPIQWHKTLKMHVCVCHSSQQSCFRAQSRAHWLLGPGYWQSWNKQAFLHLFFVLRTKKTSEMFVQLNWHTPTPERTCICLGWIYFRLSYCTHRRTTHPSLSAHRHAALTVSATDGLSAQLTEILMRKKKPFGIVTSETTGFKTGRNIAIDWWDYSGLYTILLS